MTARTEVNFQLYDSENKIISTSGGVVYVATADGAAKNAITDKDGVALTNPRALTAGSLFVLCAGNSCYRRSVHSGARWSIRG